MKILGYTVLEEIKKGWSKDKKYCIRDDNGTKYLLRISDASQYEYRKAEFESMKQVAELGIRMCLPISFGTCDEGVYSVQSWVDGNDLCEVIGTYSDEECYSYGVEAGQFLKKLHSIPAPDTVKPWEEYFNRKMDRKIAMYRDCSLKYENGEAFIEYIEAHRHLLKGRPQNYQHGDYHIGNFMLDNDGKLVVIDFNRPDFGDPWEEFNRIVWSAQASPAFARGMVDGYFDKAVPIEFWEILAMYVASNTLSSLPWAIPFGQDEIDVMTKQAEDVLNWYDGMKNVIPKWYTDKN